MTTGYPFPAVPVSHLPGQSVALPRSIAPILPSAVRYQGRRSSRALVVSAILISASLHAALLFGIGPPRQRVVPQPADEGVFTIRLVIPEIKDLDEPEPISTDGETTPIDLGTLVPMQPDVPQLARPSDFVQQINFASLLEQPDFSKLNVYAVPEHIRTSGSKLAEQLGKIFNLSDLDRAPEPVLQPAPLFPIVMRREAQTGTVAVEFIVDTQGKVLDPVVVDTTHSGFNDAALAGVSRWKFRPGTKAGRKVNTRMRVPIVFKLLDEVD